MNELKNNCFGYVKLSGCTGIENVSPKAQCWLAKQLDKNNRRFDVFHYKLYLGN